MLKNLLIIFLFPIILWSQANTSSPKKDSSSFKKGYKKGYDLTSKKGVWVDSIINIKEFGTNGSSLNSNWKFIANDNRAYAQANFDDKSWATKNIDDNIYSYLNNEKAQTAWFRKIVYIDSATINKPILLRIINSGITEVYLDGQLIIIPETIGKKKLKYKFHQFGVPYPLTFNKPGKHVFAIKYRFQALHFPENELDIYPVSIRLNTPTAYANTNISKSSLEKLASGIFIGFFFMMAFLHFFFHYFFKNQRFNLYFFISLLLFGINFYYKNIIDNYFDLNVLITHKLILKIMFFAGHAVLMYAICMFLSIKNKTLYWIVIGLSFLINILSTFNIISVWMIYISFLLFIFYYIYLIWTEARKGNVNAKLLLKAVTILFVTLVVFFIIMILYFAIMGQNNEMEADVWLPIMGVIALVGPQLAFSGAVSFSLAKDYVQTNKMLNQKLAEVESLSKEKENILEQQNTILEKTVEQRTQELSKSITELTAAQNLLVQSEKLAALGELTAGIAHEIQNPLNFVNNFSEVNKELIDELNTEIDNGNYQDVKDIAADIKTNQEKINHHGKRAASIVKGMLQHSRNSNGQKEMTDVNALADEYLRLAYHGLRAKDKTFNANMSTDFDPEIKEINIVNQDIGRVFLNLITNAFHTVNQKAKTAENYKPTVTVITKKTDKEVVITVKDNGNGIEKQNIEKIFQPFFTTKPTGEGTGLGLSLAYDIVKKGHGGSLEVQSEVGMGTEFVVKLPISN
jgi:two-component system, NtrC family, sensor kinase